MPIQVVPVSGETSNTTPMPVVVPGQIVKAALLKAGVNVLDTIAMPVFNGPVTGIWLPFKTPTVLIEIGTNAADADDAAANRRIAISFFKVCSNSTHPI